jgi:hypothetical protein
LAHFRLPHLEAYSPRAFTRKDYSFLAMQKCNEYQQHQNSMVKKVGDTLTRRMRASMLHANLPPHSWYHGH